MSSRHIRKLQKQRELEASENQATGASDESDDEPSPVAAKPRVSLFAALGGDDDEDEQEDEEDEAEQDTVPEKEDVIESQQSANASKSKKKKKKKKKAKAKAADETATTRTEDRGAGESEDEIDKALKALKMDTGSKVNAAGEAASAPSTRRINELLSINPHNLKAVNEMRSLFGRDIIESAAAEEEQERNRQRRGPQQRQVDLETFLRGHPGEKKLPEVSLRRNVFIQGRDHWPRQSAGGLTMQEVRKAPDGSWTEYAYVHDNHYDGVQAFFFSCVQIGDPMRMVHLLKEVPYHVSTLLQVSSVAKQDQNMALAAELCERALFTFGRVTTTAFRQNIEQGRARLDFRRPENRQFWLAGYHYIKSLIRKGTYRTALEWAKLLYMFDPKDPYAMRHFIQFLAIRAREGRWLCDLVEEMEQTGDNRDTVYLRQTLVLAKLLNGDVEAARADLAAGMRRVPWLYCALFQELNLDTPPSIWGVNADTDSRAFWTKLYIYQTKDLWNNTQAIEALQTVAKGLDKVDKSLLPVDDAPVDLGSARLAYLEGQTSLLAVAPRKLLDSQPNYEFDPLPPAEEDNIFTSEGTRLPWMDKNRSGSTAQMREFGDRMRNIFDRQAAAQAAVGGGGARAGGLLGALDDEDADEEADIARQLQMDEEELRRDLEEEVRRGGGGEGGGAGGGGGGLFAAMLQLLGGVRGAGDAETGHEDEEADHDYEDDEVDAHGDRGLPGAWPDED